MRTKQKIMKMEYKNILPYFSNITQHLTESRKIILLISVIMFLAFYIMFPTTNTSAESFQSSQSVSFTLNPTISINVGGDLVIESLTPGDYKDSNIITVTATSNAVSGYTLSGTVGNSTHTSPSFDNTNLNHTNGTNTFTNLSTNKTSLSDFDENSNTWGYSWCSGTCTASTETTSWVSGNVGSTTQGYNGLPIYTTDSPIQFINSTSSDSSTISFKIGARSTTTQIAGEYTNVINFIGVANHNPTYITLEDATYMQDDFSCVATEYGTVKSLIDRRDQQSYLVAKANDGNCWMIENLKIGKTLTESGDSITLTPANSNINDNYILNFSNMPTDGKFHAYTIDGIEYQNNSTEFYCAEGTTNTFDSCYYNWYTATAGAGTTAKTSGSVDTSICPAGWSLPTSGSGGQFQALYNQYPSAAQMEVDKPTTTKNNSAGKIPGFLLSGLYSTGGANYLGTVGFYWYRTAGNAMNAHGLSMSASSVGPAGGYYKYVGLAVRCVKSS